MEISIQEYMYRSSHRYQLRGLRYSYKKTLGQPNGEDTQDPPTLSQIKQTTKANLYKDKKKPE